MWDTEIIAEVKIDKSGRVVLPAKLRRVANITEGKAIAIAYPGKITIYQPKTSEREIEEWYRKMKEIVLEIRELREEVKWMDEEYVWKKLGL